MLTHGFEHNFYFGEFLVEPKANLLVKNGQSKRIESKVMQLLIVLASQENQVVERRSIIESIWPNTIVGEEAISRLVFALRAALGDDAKSPKFIETIPKKGYRFIASVEWQTDTTDASKEESANLNCESNRTRYVRSWGLAVLGLLVGITLLINGQVFSTQGAYEVKSLLPVAKSKGSERDFSFHPDGQSILYIHQTESGKNILSRGLSSGAVKVITQDDWAQRSPLWLDANTLLYIRHNNEHYQIVRQDAQGQIDVLHQVSEGMYQLALHPEQPELVTFNELMIGPGKMWVELKTLNLINGQISSYKDTIDGFPDNAFHPAISADGSHLYFHSGGKQKETLVSVDLTNKRVQVLSDEFKEISDVSVTATNQLLISARFNELQGLWLLEPKSAEPELILASSGTQQILQAEPAENGTLYYATFEKGQDIGIAEVANQSVDSLPRLNTYSDEKFAVLSDDKKLLYYVSNRSGYDELWRYQFATGESKKITQLQASWIHRPVISPSGRYLAFCFRKAQLKLTVFDIQAGRQLSEVSIDNMKFPLGWSLDEETLYVSEHNQDISLYAVSRHDLAATLIKDSAGLFAQAGNVDNEIRFVDYQSQALAVSKPNGVDLQPISGPIDGLSNLMPGQLTTSDDALFYIRTDGERRYLERQRLTREPAKETLMTLPANARVTDISAEGDLVLFTKSAPPEGDIVRLQWRQQ